MSMEGAAAPFVGPSQKEVIARLKSWRVKKKLPIVLGSGEPQAVILFEDKRWVLRKLESDPEKLRAIRERQRAKNYYVPEHNFGALVPGTIVLSEATLKAFIAQIQAMRWTYGP